MKILMVSGAMIGFAIGIVAGLAGENSWPAIFWRASAGALVLGWLMRWWGRIWLTNLKQTRDHQLAVLKAQRKEAKNSSSATL